MSTCTSSPPAAAAAAPSRPSYGVADRTTTASDLVADLVSRPTSGARNIPTACEAALTIGATTTGCHHHSNAGTCFRASLADALIAVRVSPTAARARAYELSQSLPEPDRWRLLAASRDPWLFVERAIDTLGLTWREKEQLRLRDLAADGSTLTAAGRTIVVPAPMRELLANFRAIRVTEGGTGARPLLVPHDDRVKRHWQATRTPVAHVG